MGWGVLLWGDMWSAVPHPSAPSNFQEGNWCQRTQPGFLVAQTVVLSSGYQFFGMPVVVERSQGTGRELGMGGLPRGLVLGTSCDTFPVDQRCSFPSLLHQINLKSL